MIYICIYQNLVTAAPITPLHRCTAVRQVFTRSLCAHSVPIASILLLPHRCISHRCKSGIHALTLSMPIASILSPPHRCIADRSTSGIHALTLSQLHQSCHRRIAALLHRCTLGIHALTLSQLHQSCHRRTAASPLYVRYSRAHSVPITSILSPPHCYIADRCTSSIHTLTLSQLHQSCHRRTVALHCIAIPLYCYTILPTYIEWLVIHTLIPQSIASHFYIP